MLPAYEKIFSTMAVFYQAWVDITSTEYVYKDPNSALYQAYKALALVYAKDEAGNTVEAGVAGFTEEYWQVANDIYNYALTKDTTTAFAMSYDAYALAGYIAGDLFCQAMEALEKSGKALSRANLVEVMESQDFDLSLVQSISYANGVRAGVEAFSLNMFYDVHAYDPTKAHSAASAPVYTLTSIQEYRDLLGK